VLVDDEHLIRAALAQALSDSGIELVGEAVNGEDAKAGASSASCSIAWMATSISTMLEGDLS
jgi:DNA-binding NarL/FixJ family response regulator